MTAARTSHGGQADFYRTQASLMNEQAASAVLDNVRDRCLRSAEAWTQMATRAERHRASVEKSEAVKAAAAADAIEAQGVGDFA
jgi:hypothetical protein